MEPIHGHERVIDAQVMMHISDFAVLNSRNGHDGMAAEDVEIRTLTAVFQQLPFSLRVEGVRQRLSLQGLDVPSRIHDGAVTHSPTHQGTHGHGRGEERLVGVVFSPGYLAGEGRLVEKGEDGIDNLKVQLNQINDGGLADDIRGPPAGRRLRLDTGIGARKLNLGDYAQVALRWRSR